MATATTIKTKPEILENRFLIPYVDWQGYESLLIHVLGDRRSIRVTYDQGNMELMSPSAIHDRYDYLLARMVVTITEELEIAVIGTKSKTLRRRDLDRGLEPNASYYLANVGRLTESADLDLNVIPPPDLVIEIEITNSILDKLKVYEALGVPEIWRYDGESMTVLVLGIDGAYVSAGRSLCFPFLPMGELERFLEDYLPVNDTAWARRFQTWVRDVLLPRYQAPIEEG